MPALSSPAATELLDVLRERGYEPDEDAPEFVRAYLVFSGLGSVRVIIGDADVTVCAFDRYMAERWSARFTNLTPLAAIIAVIDAAEADARAGAR